MISAGIRDELFRTQLNSRIWFLHLLLKRYRTSNRILRNKKFASYQTWCEDVQIQFDYVVWHIVCRSGRTSHAEYEGKVEIGTWLRDRSLKSNVSISFVQTGVALSDLGVWISISKYDIDEYCRMLSNKMLQQAVHLPMKKIKCFFETIKYACIFGLNLNTLQHQTSCTWVHDAHQQYCFATSFRISWRSKRWVCFVHSGMRWACRVCDCAATLYNFGKNRAKFLYGRINPVLGKNRKNQAKMFFTSKHVFAYGKALLAFHYRRDYGFGGRQLFHANCFLFPLHARYTWTE